MAVPAPISKPYIQTVLDAIPAEELGYCQCHEHLFISKGKSYEINSALWMDDLFATTQELALYKNAGGCSLVDAQPFGCGRLAGYLEKASCYSGVNVIASTGFHKLVFYDENHWIHKLDEEALSQLFISELTDGMFTNEDRGFPTHRIRAKAGIIKTAVDSFGIKGEYTKLLSAAANASRITGFPLMCHIEKDADVFKVIEFFSQWGVNPEKLILCHLDRAKYDLACHKEIAGMGVYLEYDTIARFKYHSNEMEIRLIQQMLESGFEDRVLLGLDTTRERLKSYGGSIGLSYIRESFIPIMLEAGISQDAIYKMTVKNPQKALSIL